MAARPTTACPLSGNAPRVTTADLRPADPRHDRAGPSTISTATVHVLMNDYWPSIIACEPAAYPTRPFPATATGAASPTRRLPEEPSARPGAGTTRPVLHGKSWIIQSIREEPCPTRLHLPSQPALPRPPRRTAPPLIADDGLARRNEPMPFTWAPVYRLACLGSPKRPLACGSSGRWLSRPDARAHHERAGQRGCAPDRPVACGAKRLHAEHRRRPDDCRRAPWLPGPTTRVAFHTRRLRRLLLGRARVQGQQRPAAAAPRSRAGGLQPCPTGRGADRVRGNPACSDPLAGLRHGRVPGGRPLRRGLQRLGRIVN
jgi:hypothetical protein